MAKVQTGLFLIGIGIGMVVNSIIRLPADFAFVMQILWLVFILVGTYFIINSSG